MDHIKQNKTNMDVHMAYASDSKNTRNDALFPRTALPVSLLRPPGRVNPAANVIVANRAATTDSVFRIWSRFVPGWMYVVFRYGFTLICLHIFACR
ncbi:hypothetical protein BVRB_6g128570 [Beta vulgaris subsp. vulgaris]|nr:hypothetical protein BVRB_6g128570 [Beta vulgaris subsp. vulgaris]